MSESELRRAHALIEAGEFAAAAALLEALLLQPAAAADAHNGLGLLAEAGGDLVAAERAYRRALALRREPEFYNNLAICLLRQGHLDEVLAGLREGGLELPPETAYNLALALAAQGRYWEAFGPLAWLLGRSPGFGPALPLIEALLKALPAEAGTLERLQRELAAAPGEPLWQLALACCYELRGQRAMASRAYAAALALAPELLPVYSRLIAGLQDQGRYGEALAAARARFAREASLDALVGLIVSLQQPIPASEAEALALQAEMISLLSHYGQPGPFSALAGRTAARPAILPYYPCYQQGLDRPLQELLAGFFARFLRRFEAPLPVPAGPQPRLGIFSVRLYRHSVTDFLLRAFETLLGSGRFETWVFYYPLAAGREDELTRRLQAEADHFVVLPGDYGQAAAQLAALGLDLLLFADVGMESYTYSLALQRLARFQLALPGHPVTTGMPTIDYFVSSELLESAEADSHYSETLLRLPGLPDYARPALPPPAARDALGLPAGRLYFCPMTLFKLSPGFDRVLAGILAADPEARVLLLEHKQGLHQKLQARFAAGWPELAARLQFLPWSDRQTFFQRLRAVDVVLDSFPFGGGNTAYQALGLGCPLVCLDLPWQKGRWTQGLYRQMGLTELIAPSPEAYVALAVGLARDPERQARLRAEILARSAVLFDNPTWSQALLEFCCELTAPPRT